MHCRSPTASSPGETNTDSLLRWSSRGATFHLFPSLEIHFARANRVLLFPVVTRDNKFQHSQDFSFRASNFWFVFTSPHTFQRLSTPSLFDSEQFRPAVRTDGDGCWFVSPLDLVSPRSHSAAFLPPLCNRRAVGEVCWCLGRCLDGCFHRQRGGLDKKRRISCYLQVPVVIS